MSIRKKLAAGEFLTLVELEPPKGINVAPFLESASRVKAGPTPLWCRKWPTR
jgi:hypothetical protein